MKRNILHTLWMAAVLPLLLASCQQEELPGMNGTNDLTPLAITVSDGGYAPADGRQKTVTRATENGYRTDFTAGDECGLYIVRDGKAVCENVKLTATTGADGKLTWKPENSEALIGGFTNESYFLYYPYQAVMTDKSNASATDDKDFFAPLISGWQPAADQSDYVAGYTAGDLMTATGMATKGTDGKRQLSFSMTHRMALAVVEMPKTAYRFTDSSIPDYVIATTADFDGSAKPYRNTDGTYRYLVRPGQDNATPLTGSYADGKKEFTITPNNISASSCKTYRVDGAPTIDKEHNLQQGDYFCKNSSNTWYIIPGTETPGSECIGIVFHAGQYENDKSDYSSTGIGQTQCHGYVVALQDATSGYCTWGVYGKELGCCPTDGGGNNLDNYNYPNIDWNGYKWTQTIITAAGGKDKLNATEEAGYPATYYAVVDYENKVKSPANSSGWFLPSIGQMWNIYQNHSSLFDGKTGAEGLKSDWYCSSSEYYNTPADFALYVHVGDGYVSLNLKNRRSGYVRPVLAF